MSKPKASGANANSSSNGEPDPSMAPSAVMMDSMLALEALLEIKTKNPTSSNARRVNSNVPRLDMTSQKPQIVPIAPKIQESRQEPKVPRNLVAHKSTRAENKSSLELSGAHQQSLSSENVQRNGYLSPEGRPSLHYEQTFVPSYVARQHPSPYMPQFQTNSPSNNSPGNPLNVTQVVTQQHIMPVGSPTSSTNHLWSSGQYIYHPVRPTSIMSDAPALSAPQSQVSVSNASDTIGNSCDTYAHLEPHSNASMSSRSSTASTSCELPATSIRAAQVEAALRSKPQRGKKRENLSMSERLELTRTRNREHAKSTRIRKKARFEELCNREMEWHKYHETEILDSARRQCLVDFMRFRSSAMKAASKAVMQGKTSATELSTSQNDYQPNESSDSSSDATVQISNYTDNCGINFSEELTGLPHQTSTSSQSINGKDLGWETFVEDPLKFIFTSHHSFTGCLAQAPSDGVQGLSKVEAALGACVTSQLIQEGRKILALWIEVLDGAEGVALVRDTALLQFQLVVIYEETVTSRDTSIPLGKCSTEHKHDPKSFNAACGVLRVTFASSSHKMTSLEICSCDSSLARSWQGPSNSPSDRNGCDSNDSVSAWPSVVSLEHPCVDVSHNQNQVKIHKDKLG